MTIRTFWTIFIKILGIWLVIESITVIQQFLSTLSTLRFNNENNFYGTIIALLLLTIIIYILVLRLLLFKTSWLIDKMHLENGFLEEKIELNIKSTTVLSIATIVIGGLIFVDSLPQLCKQIFMYFQQRNVFGESPTSGWIIFQFVKTSIGYLLMTNSKLIAKFIDKQSREQNDSVE
ncbi:hypothetical protein GM921_10095 [Pedobacter sp. LMG 31464]|uniref:Uncharacterized protein n=1 Tax=Pedobacter planticolens TaxID=2679964 RepID=A0A923E1N7_9SPHI|nr:hypothetical protein [Pedobacter planticolens]MBB2145837.1 hypothetical protein [Pedobacter planticolens]